MDQVELSLLVDIGLKFYAVPSRPTCQSDIEVNLFGHRFNRFSGKAQVRRAVLRQLLLIQHSIIYKRSELSTLIATFLRRSYGRTW